MEVCVGFIDFPYFLLEACLASALLSGSSALVGCFLLIRRKALLGDMIGHSVLPGLCVGFILAGYEKSPLLLSGGAFVSALLAAFLQDSIARHSRVKEGTSMALLLTGFYAVGVVILTELQNRSSSNVSGLDSYLFGSAASISRGDLYAACALITVQGLIVFLLLKELRLATFDPLFAETQGFKSKRYAQLISAMTTVTVIFALPAVGLILASALLVLPAACASMLTRNLGPRLLLSTGIGLILGFVGAYLSTLRDRIPTGPSIILLHTSVFVIIASVLSIKRRRQALRTYV
jgi:manganese/zinc/iron transport system permease protein